MTILSQATVTQYGGKTMSLVETGAKSLVIYASNLQARDPWLELAKKHADDAGAAVAKAEKAAGDAAAEVPKAAAEADRATTEASKAETARQGAETARQGAEHAEDGAETAEVTAGRHKTDANAAKTAAETAKSQAETAKKLADDAAARAEKAAGSIVDPFVDMGDWMPSLGYPTKPSHSALWNCTERHELPQYGALAGTIWEPGDTLRYSRKTGNFSRLTGDPVGGGEPGETTFPDDIVLLPEKALRFKKTADDPNPMYAVGLDHDNDLLYGDWQLTRQLGFLCQNIDNIYAVEELDENGNAPPGKKHQVLTSKSGLSKTATAVQEILSPLRIKSQYLDVQHVRFWDDKGRIGFNKDYGAYIQTKNGHTLYVGGVGDDAPRWGLKKIFHQGFLPSAADVGAAPKTHSHTWSQISGAPETATRWPKFTEVTQVPESAKRWPKWGEVADKPGTMPPSAHTHSIANVTDLQTQLYYAQGLNVGASSVDPNTTADHVILSNHAHSPGGGKYWHITTTFYSSKTGTANRAQIALEYNPSGSNCRMYCRSYYTSTGWTAWAMVYTSRQKPTAADVGAAPKAHKHPWGDIDGKPSTATRWPSWGEVTGKPGTMPPSSHTHPWSQVTGQPATATRWPTAAEAGALPSNSGARHWHDSGGHVRTSLWCRSAHGFLPEGNGKSSVGTPGWAFAGAYINKIYFGSTTGYGYVKNGQKNTVQLGNSSGYVDIGSQNTSYTHYWSSRGHHYFYGQVTSQGNVSAYSDRRIKTNIERIPDALDKVCQLSGYTFDRTDTEEPMRQTGVIAQEVLEVLPEAVTGGATEDDPEGKYQVAYGNLVGLLIEAIKELRDEVEVLKNGSTK
ncbi:pyocin knob domain-containing S74 family peptidase [Shewanella submarina]|uniref:Pyocin knob domain-containing S74 family peptidase n=1 Tax=Shewanella submarina TaxID=2016376 RepID=A0ABV7G8H2_9GAMM|nr:pyocin knob domain-containing S74 family peptidase [Shewanella submarina]MCL1038332.1 pyocin knob domain-containing S74 family peptidase [Shewanella submarina]